MDASRAKTILLWTGLVSLCFLGIPLHLSGKSDVSSDVDNQDQLQYIWGNYTHYYNKNYTKDEIRNRLPHFKKSLEQIELLNSPSHRLKLSNGEGSEKNIVGTWRDGMRKNVGVAAWGLTDLADMSPDEFQETYLDKSLLDRILRRRKSNYRNHERVEDNLITRKRKKRSTIPDKVDWRSKDTVTAVKHQKSCGACWAFSTVETVESMHAIQGGQLKTLSTQQLIDCATEHNNGCSGGDTCTAIQWMATHKLATEAEYPLTLKDGTCRIQSAPSGVQVNGNYSCDGYEGREDKILEIVANHGPVAVAVDATNWQFYMGGVIQWNCDSRVNHAVQIVGYDKTSDPPHYILRNSWGPSFGDNGYLYVAIGSNLCGIAVEVTYLSVQ